MNKCHRLDRKSTGHTFDIIMPSHQRKWTRRALFLQSMDGNAITTACPVAHAFPGVIQL